MSRAVGRGLLWAGVLWFAGASAHHNAAAHYFTDRKTSIEGVVTQFRLINPHARLYFSVTTAQGQSESWIAEGDAASVLTRRGWKGDEIKRGDRVKIVGHPARDGSKMIEWTTLELPDGRVLGGGNGINDERKKQLEELERRRRGSQPATPAPGASSTSPSTTTTPTKEQLTASGRLSISSTRTMLDFLMALQGSGLASFVLTSALGFPLLLCVHAMGMGFLVGMLVLIDMRILGFAPAVALPELGKYFRVVWLALVLNFVSGALMFVGYAVDDFYNDSFRIKLLLVVTGVIIARVIQVRLFDPRRSQTQASGPMKVLAAVSMVCWLGAITAGRLIAYIR